MKLIEYFQSLFNRIASRIQQQKSTKDPVELNHLPDLCLLAIFTRLPQADLITVGRVCTSWKSLVLEVSNKITSLTIRISNYGNSYGVRSRFVHPYTELLVQNDNDQLIEYLTYDQKKYTKWNSLAFTCAQFNLTLVKQVMNTFPAITSLELSHYDLSSTESLEAINQLLTHYHSQLISIKLKCKTKIEELDCSSLLTSINRMPSPMRTLLLELGDLNQSVCLKDQNPEPLPIISQLERFCSNLSYLDKVEQMTSIKNAILSNPNLRQVGLLCGASLEPTISPLEMEFRARITHLVDPFRKPQYIESYDLPRYCLYYPSVTNVNLELNVSELLNATLIQLSELSQLIHLNIKINFWEQNRKEEKRLVLLQLPSVKIIEFDLPNSKSFENFASLRIPYHFPQVEVIQVMFCGWASEQPFDDDDDDNVAIYDHLKTECPRLHHLYSRSKLIWCL